ncbi:MAG: hypothetical protein LUF85_02365 [Bacteroides sp.]|nr:hypothetical protein [Bacteroides sp.]
MKKKSLLFIFLVSFLCCFHTVATSAQDAALLDPVPDVYFRWEGNVGIATLIIPEGYPQVVALDLIPGMEGTISGRIINYTMDKAEWDGKARVGGSVFFADGSWAAFDYVFQ